ncbi:MAG: sigma factor-like helix-turn-helix DNA-binding protein, partial [Marmoricola sp.]
MADFPDFIELHERSHERLALQALALTGDPHAAAAGVREAFIAASQHWKKVSLLADPEEWVRSRAWSMATRRHLTHPWHRDDRVTPEQSAVLRSLQQLRDNQRRALLLHHLAGQSASDISAELGLTQTQCAQALQDAVDAYTRALQITGDQVLASLQQLQPLVELS